jgi:hypothetical protein
LVGSRDLTLRSRVASGDDGDDETMTNIEDRIIEAKDLVNYILDYLITILLGSNFNVVY